MNDKIYAHILVAKETATLKKSITARDIFAALDTAAPTPLSDLFSYPFCIKPVSFNMADSLPNRRSVTAFKSLKKAKYISYFLLERIRRDMGALSGAEALVTMLVFGKAYTEGDYIFSDTESVDIGIKPHIDPSLEDPFVMSVPKGEKMWFFSERQLLKPHDSINICGIDFEVAEITALENSGENICLQCDFPAHENPLLAKNSKSLFSVNLDDSGTKYILSGSVIDSGDRLLNEGLNLGPVLIKF